MQTISKSVSLSSLWKCAKEGTLSQPKWTHCTLWFLWMTQKPNRFPLHMNKDFCFGLFLCSWNRFKHYTHHHSHPIQLPLFCHTTNQWYTHHHIYQHIIFLFVHKVLNIQHKRFNFQEKSYSHCIVTGNEHINLQYCWKNQNHKFHNDHQCLGIVDNDLGHILYTLNLQTNGTQFYTRYIFSEIPDTAHIFKPSIPDNQYVQPYMDEGHAL